MTCPVCGNPTKRQQRYCSKSCWYSSAEFAALQSGICRNGVKVATDCPICGEPHSRSKTGPCGRCYQQSYRSDPAKGTERRKKHNDSVKRYAKLNPDKRSVWVQRYRAKVCYYTPAELLAARRAIRDLERVCALAKATKPAGVRNAG